MPDEEESVFEEFLPDPVENEKEVFSPFLSSRDDGVQETDVFSDLLGVDSPGEADGLSQRNQQLEKLGFDLPGERDPEGVFFGVLDFLSRGNYASAKAADVLFNEDGFAMSRAAAASIGEALVPHERLTYSDVLRRAHPEWTEKNPIKTELTGLAFDIALDPTTYLGIGNVGKIRFVPRLGNALKKTGTLKKLGGKAFTKGFMLSDEGASAFKSLVKAEKSRSSVRGLKSVDQFSGLTKEELLDPVVRAEARMTKLLGTEAGSKFLDTRSGLKFGKKLLLEAEDVKAFSKALHLDSFLGSLKELPGVKLLDKTFRRWGGELPEEYRILAEQFQGLKNAVPRMVGNTTAKLFKDLDNAGIERVGKVALQIDSATSRKTKDLGRSLNTAEAQAIVRSSIEEAGLKDPEHDALVRMMAEFSRMADIETKAGLLKSRIVNYVPRFYENHRKLAGLRQTLLRKLTDKGTGAGADFKGLAAQLGADNKRVFETQEQARAAGYDVISNAAQIFATRLAAHEEALRTKEFVRSVNSLFGTRMEDLKSFGTKTLKKLPKSVREDLTFIGEGKYSRGAHSAVDGLLRVYDRLLQGFKQSATVVRPGFGVRQGFSNPLQSFLANGVGAFDPRSYRDAVAIMMGKASDFVLEDVLGRQYQGEDLVDILLKNDVLRNSTVDGLNPTQGRGVGHGVAKALRSSKRAERFNKALGDSKAAQGLSALFRGALRYMELPAKIEDVGRASIFLNHLRKGHSPKSAVRQAVNPGLFDYGHGMSLVEERVIKRIIPFYSFQRFVVPMLLNSMAKKPGRLANLNKAAQSLGKGLSAIQSDRPLNESERAVLGDWLLEQPHVFSGMSQDGQAVFRTFNNFSPTDILNIFQTDEKGGLDLQRTVVKGGLAQITPFLKVPLEWALDHDFFTDRAVSDLERQGDLDFDSFLSNVSAGLGVQAAGPIGGLVGKIFGSGVSESGGAKELVKKMFSWEEGIDRRGKRDVHINPYIIHGMTSVFPGLSDYINISDQDNTPLERTMRFLFGVGTVKLDLKEQLGFKVRRMERERQELVSDLLKAEREKTPNRAEKARDELAEFMAQLKEEHDLLTRRDVRGGE